MVVQRSSALLPSKRPAGNRPGRHSQAQVQKGHASQEKPSVVYTSTDAWGNGNPHRDWIEKKKRLNLPDGPWSERRKWCSQTIHSHTGRSCHVCRRKKPDASWGPQSQKVITILSNPFMYQSSDAAHAAGWRWYAKPQSQAHDHQWWPPQSMCDIYTSLHGPLTLPLSTTDLFPVLDVMVDTAKAMIA